MGSGADALKAAIDEAWREFDIPAPSTTGVCVNCCMDPAIEADFLKRKARELPVEYVWDWYFAAYDDYIRHAHVAWFLPRVMEILASGKDVASGGSQVAFKRLPLVGFPDRWPERQVAAVNHFAVAFFAAVLHGELQGGVEDIDSSLCMFGEGGIDVGPMLRLMDALPDDDLVNALYDEWVFGETGEISLDAFWSREPAKSMAWEWYTSPTLLARMERAALAGNEKAFPVHDAIAQAQVNTAP